MAEKLKSLEFSKTSFWGPAFYVYLDCSKKTLRTASSPGGIEINLKSPSLEEGDTFKEIKLTDEELDSLLKKIAQCKIDSWKESYDDLDISDGEQWEITLKFKNKSKLITRYGSNEYPIYWEEFLKIFE